jgi:putative transposase
VTHDENVAASAVCAGMAGFRRPSHESFNSRLRDESLNISIFWSRKARVVIGDWKEDYKQPAAQLARLSGLSTLPAACTHR